MAEQKKKTFGSLQPDIDDILSWGEDAFAPASVSEKENFIQDRKSVSYWADAWRRLKKNTVAMVAMVIVILICLFAFVGPMFVPYKNGQIIKGANNLHPWHISYEDQQKINAYMEEKNGAANLDPDEAVEQARAEAEAQGKKLSRVDEAKIRAQAKAAAENASENQITQEQAMKDLGIKYKLFGYSAEELERKANGEDVFPHVFGTDLHGRDIMVRTMMGTRMSIIVGIFAALLVLCIGAFSLYFSRIVSSSSIC